MKNMTIYCTWWAIQINCPLGPTQAFGLMVSHRHFYLVATAREAKEKLGLGKKQRYIINICRRVQTPAASLWPQCSAAKGQRKVNPPHGWSAKGSALPDTSPCDAAVRPMLVRRWSMLGTGWDSTALSSCDTVCREGNATFEWGDSRER